MWPGAVQYANGGSLLSRLRCCVRGCLGMPDGIDTPVLPPVKPRDACIAPRRLKGRTGAGLGACLRPVRRAFGRRRRIVDQRQVSWLVAFEIVFCLAIPTLFVGTASAHALAPQDGNDLSRSRASGNFVADEIRHHRQAQALPSKGPSYGRAALLPVAIPFVTHFSAVTALVHGK
jgi:hypothetical protein